MLNSDLSGEKALLAKWLWLAEARPQARLRLYCLAHAGAGASTFARWAAVVPPEIEVAPIQLPGRETRADEQPLRQFAPAVEAIARVIKLDERPFALFGHSVGGKLATHVAMGLESGSRRPLHLFISGTPVVPRERFIHTLQGAFFARYISERIAPLPAELTNDPQLWSFFERPLRADIEAHETDEQAPRKLAVPLTVFAGTRDRVVTEAELAGWQDWSAQPVRHERVDADHFSYRNEPQEYLRTIVDVLISRA
jgi:surfactin synthase thioesterase subunit